MVEIYLFTRKECIRCPAAELIVREAVDETRTSLNVVDADNISNRLMLELLENSIFILSTPTVIIRDDNRQLKVFSYGEIPDREDLIRTIKR